MILSPEVQARRDALDAEYGHYTAANVKRKVNVLYRQYPELREALTLHVRGIGAVRSGMRPELTPETIARARIFRQTGSRQIALHQYQAIYKEVPIPGNREERARSVFAELRSLSEWSLLHQKFLAADGTISLYHGTRSKRMTKAALLEHLNAGTHRSGMSFTDNPEIAAIFGTRGKRSTVVAANVPARSVIAWHGMLPNIWGSHNQLELDSEFIVGAGPLSGVRVLSPAEVDTLRAQTAQKASGA